MSLETELLQNADLIVLVVIPIMLKMERRIARLEWEFKKYCGRGPESPPALEELL